MSAEKHGFVRVASLSTEVQIADPTANAAAILKVAGDLQTRGVSVAVGPELCLSGYSAEDLFFSDTLLADTRQGLATIATQNPLPLLVVGAPWQLRDGRLLNCAVAIGGGRVLGWCLNLCIRTTASFMTFVGLLQARKSMKQSSIPHSDSSNFAAISS